MRVEYDEDYLAGLVNVEKIDRDEHLVEMVLVLKRMTLDIVGENAEFSIHPVGYIPTVHYMFVSGGETFIEQLPRYVENAEISTPSIEVGTDLHIEFKTDSIILDDAAVMSFIKRIVRPSSIERAIQNIHTINVHLKSDDAGKIKLLLDGTVFITIDRVGSATVYRSSVEEKDTRVTDGMLM